MLSIILFYFVYFVFIVRPLQFYFVELSIFKINKKGVWYNMIYLKEIKNIKNKKLEILKTAGNGELIKNQEEIS